ncbi:MAG: hypothetical protein K2K25_03500 [Muribaculaceae bacterium]|nr:hypothetical protein [Muribaculaceae bacterium]
MNYKRRLTFAQLIKLMHDVTSKYGRLTQRDTITDIADLSDSLEIAIKNSTYVERFWGIRSTGTVMTSTPNFEDRYNQIQELYRIMWSENSGWTFDVL